MGMLLLITESVRRSGRALAALGSVVLALFALMVVAPAAHAQNRFVPVAGVTTFEQTFSVSTGRSRRVLYIRPVAAPAGRVPVMVVLHYGGGGPEVMANLIQLGELVRDTGIWAIVPEASGRAWNHDPRRDSNRNADDVDLITRVIDNAVGSFPVDVRRVYMTGFSSGGFMAQRYVCEHPERVTAMAYVSSTLLDTLASTCILSSATPTLGMHGTSDSRVNYGDRVGLSSAPDTARYYAGRNGCLGAPTRTRLPDIARDGTTVDLDSWTSCSSAKQVRFYTINSGGHTWPGKASAACIRGKTSGDVNANEQRMLNQ